MGGVRIYDYIYSNKNPLVINKKRNKLWQQQ